MSAPAEGGYGEPRIAPFSGGAVGAVSLQFDDSMDTHVQNAIPLLNRNHIRATFYVNPSRPQYQSHLRAWEVAVPKAGHEIGNHTMHHSGARNIAELESEIDACSRALAKVWGPKPALHTFAIPGGVSWEVTPEQLSDVLEKRNLVLADERTFFDEAKTDPMVFVRQALDKREWMRIGMHGVGGEWLSTSVPTLRRMVDFLVAHRDTLWTAPTVEVHKYVAERDAALPPTLHEISGEGFIVKVPLDTKKLKTVSLYDQPLTVEVPVPESWESFKLKQGSRLQMGRTIREGGRTLIRLDVVPDGSDARVTRA